MAQDKFERLYDHDLQTHMQGHIVAHDRLDLVVKEAARRCVLNGKRVLDIGISDGYTIGRLCQLRATVYGIDISEVAIRVCVEKLRDRNLGAVLEQGDLRKIPFDDGYFDIIFACEILEHMEGENLNSALAEVRRCLRVNGFFLATTPYKEDLNASMVCCPFCSRVFHSAGHFQTFDERKASNLLTSNGFNVLSVKKIYGTDMTIRLTKFSFLMPLVRLVIRLCQIDRLTHLMAIATKA